MKPIILSALAALFTFASACSTNPVTGESQLALVSESQEIELGRQTAAAAEAQLDIPALVAQGLDSVEIETMHFPVRARRTAAQ